MCPTVVNSPYSHLTPHFEFQANSFHYLCKNFPHDFSRFKHKETAPKRAR